MVEKRIAVIPARGGSKRLPGKNIISFFGKPMIAWTIEAALSTKLFETVLVSTDSEEIAQVSRRYGATVPFLRDNHADDHSTVSEATITGLKQLQKFNGKSYDTVVQLMANCPLRTAKSITKQLEFFEKRGKNRFSVLSGFSYGMFNPWWAHFKDEDGNYQKLLNDFCANTRSQDLPELLCPTGATWISSVARLEETSTFYSGHYSFFKINWMEAVDIDDYDDLQLAKAAYNILNA